MLPNLFSFDGGEIIFLSYINCTIIIIIIIIVCIIVTNN